MRESSEEAIAPRNDTYITMVITTNMQNRPVHNHAYYRLYNK